MTVLKYLQRVNEIDLMMTVLKYMQQAEWDTPEDDSFEVPVTGLNAHCYHLIKQPLMLILMPRVWHKQFFFAKAN